MPIFDHIVVGAGSAGCAVAARLSEDPVRRVLLIEAGRSDRRLEARAPAAFPSQFHGKDDWDYLTEPEPGCDGRRIFSPRGRVVGGCSTMNAMLWVRGSALDFDGWGLPGWSWEEVEAFYRRIEDHFLPGPAHGHGGPVRVRRLRDPDPVAKAFVASAVAAGVAPTDDLSGPDLDGVSLSPTTTDGGRRWSAPRAYLDVARRRRNLTVLTGALVHRVVLREGRAVGVEVEHEGRLREYVSTRDVVLSAGAFNTPHLLQLSGVGAADDLREAGITPVVESPAVGQHLQEHPFTFCNFELRAPHTGLSGADRPAEVLRWLLTRRGKLASNVAEALAHIRTRPDVPAADMQLVHAPVFFWKNGEGEHPRPAFAIAQSYWTPESRGWVKAVSPDPRAKPAVQLGMLTEREDLEAMVRGIRRTREIVEQAPLRDMVSLEITPGASVQTDEDLERWVRAHVETTYHPSCTARMGAPGEAVLDHELRVHGVENLRVADTSALPRITRANTNAPAILMGERCAAFIRDEASRARSRPPRGATVTG